MTSININNEAFRWGFPGVRVSITSSNAPSPFQPRSLSKRKTIFELVGIFLPTKFLFKAKWLGQGLVTLLPSFFNSLILFYWLALTQDLKPLFFRTCFLRWCGNWKTSNIPSYSPCIVLQSANRQPFLLSTFGSGTEYFCMDNTCSWCGCFLGMLLQLMR